MRSRMLLGVAWLAVVLLPGATLAQQVRGVTPTSVRLGVIADLSGPTNETGNPYAEGFKTAVAWVNQQGGVSGRRLELAIEDGKYDVAAEQALFRKFVTLDNVLGGVTYTTGSQIPLFPQYERERFVAIPVSLSEFLVTPLKKWVFSISATYTDQVKVAVDYAVKNTAGRKPRIGVVFPDNPYGHEGRDAARARAKEYGFEVAGEEIMAFNALDATSQVLNLKKANVDYVIMQEVGPTVATFIRDASRLGLETKVIGTFQTVGESLIQLSGKLAEKYYLGVHTFNGWHEEAPGMAKLREATIKITGSDRVRVRSYVQGWATALVFVEAIRLASPNVTPDSLRDAMERIRNLDTGGLTGAISFSPDDHRGGKFVRIFKANADRISFDPVTDWMAPARVR